MVGHLSEYYQRCLEFSQFMCQLFFRSQKKNSVVEGNRRGNQLTNKERKKTQHSDDDDAVLQLFQVYLIKI